ncbi:unnamed protein product [Cylicostephanus goldi]|uniref:Uncharacterized protein n=1 Tax=Cylicostephanus goldi TaxID=71465 RepID=A0A3P6UXP1_CYLGO|nr:unnamed protein product [Cylicostephanus goldi]
MRKALLNSLFYISRPRPSEIAFPRRGKIFKWYSGSSVYMVYVPQIVCFEFANCAPGDDAAKNEGGNVIAKCANNFKRLSLEESGGASVCHLSGNDLQEKSHWRTSCRTKYPKKEKKFGGELFENLPF